MKTLAANRVNPESRGKESAIARVEFGAWLAVVCVLELFVFPLVGLALAVVLTLSRLRCETRARKCVLVGVALVLVAVQIASIYVDPTGGFDMRPAGRP